MQIAQSLASLVRNNNGFFKSTKQAEFLLSQCNVNTNQYLTTGSNYGNRFETLYTLDVLGVVSIQTTGIKTQNVKITFTRLDADALAVKIQNEETKQAILKEYDSLSNQIDLIRADIAKNDRQATSFMKASLRMEDEGALAFYSAISEEYESDYQAMVLEIENLQDKSNLIMARL
jgi:hypothetical protein